MVDRVKEGNRQQEIDLERLSKDLSMAKVCILTADAHSFYIYIFEVVVNLCTHACS